MKIAFLQLTYHKTLKTGSDCDVLGTKKAPLFFHNDELSANCLNDFDDGSESLEQNSIRRD